VRDRLVGSVSRKIDALRGWWNELALEKQFALAAALVLVGGMVSTGWWVANRVGRAVIQNTAAAAALYMEGSVAPLIVELADSEQLTPATQAKLDDVLARPAISESIISMYIWRLDGTIVYSRWNEMVGKRYPISEYFARAARGDIAVAFDEQPGEHDMPERSMSPDLLEVYAPVLDPHTRRVIAVAEFYASGEKLKSDVRRETASSWLVVGHITLLMIIALSGIVVRGGRVIGEQRLQLKAQIDELRTLLGQNEDLRARLQRSNAMAAEAAERFLRRIGADLHDGPAQLLSYTLLRLHKLTPVVEKNGGDKDRRELVLIREAVNDTLREVRNISEGVALPELDPISLKEVIELAIQIHERLTNTPVARELGVLPEHAPKTLKICVYRFVQEGLTNAFRHAGGIA
jgi:signal transduction histidine kinase